MELVALFEPLPVAVADRLVGLDVVDQAERRGLVALWGEDVRLGHPLYGEVVRADLPSAARLSYVRHVAAAVGDIVPAPTPVQLLRLAILHLEAGEPAPADLLAAGARHAVARADSALGERLARAALTNDPESFDAGFMLGLALVGQRRPEEAEGVLAALAGREPDDDATVELAHLRMGALYFSGEDLAARARAVVAEAAKRVTKTAQRAVLVGAEAELGTRDQPSRRTPQVEARWPARQGSGGVGALWLLSSWRAEV